MASFAFLARAVLQRLGWPAPQAVRTRPLALSLEPELGILEQTLDIGPIPKADLTPEGAFALLRPSFHIPEEILMERLAGKTGGSDAPPWHDGSGGAPGAGVHVFRSPDTLYAPQFGAVITQNGQVLRCSVAEALYLTPTLAALPGVCMVDNAPVMNVPENIPRLGPSAIFVAWGGLHNYGHFLLDCLSSLGALDEANLLEGRLLLTPPLNAWQAEAVALYFGEAPHVLRQLDTPIVAVDDLVFASAMDHFLHAPNWPLDRVRERMLANIERSQTGMSRIYLSRRRDMKRRMINEVELEARLAERGFAIVYPEDMSVAEQIALFRDADVIVAPTGAALANTLFCKPTAKIFEIQPTNYVGIWVRGVCHLVGAIWHGYFAPSPLSESDLEIEGEARPGILFEWAVPIDPFLDFLDSRMQDPMK